MTSGLLLELIAIRLVEIKMIIVSGARNNYQFPEKFVVSDYFLYLLNKRWQINFLSKV